MRVHFIAMGGSIMHNLAVSLAKKGFIVSGSDDFIFEPSRSVLEAQGLLPEKLGWFPDRITEELDAVILGMHARSDNPELLKAKSLGLQIYSYPEFIYEQAQEKLRVVIGGSHGKTTITSMIMHVLKTLGRDFDYVVGAQVEGFDRLVRITKDSPLIILEGDEYLASAEDPRPKFLVYKANIGLISGIAWDHINVFPTIEQYEEQFNRFIESIEEKGTLVYNKEDQKVQALVSANKSKINKSGYRTPEYTINKGETYLNTPQGDLHLQIFGRHNLSNLAGAYSVCEWLGVSRQDFYEAIQSFKGASQRMEYVSSRANSVVYKDFAHSPSKVAASIHALREQYPQQQLVAVLELHTYSSLNEAYLNEYKDSMDEAAYPVVFINQASYKQKNLKPISEEALKKAFDNDRIAYIITPEDLKAYLQDMDPDNKNLLFMSSGNFGGINIVNFADSFIS